MMTSMKVIGRGRVLGLAILASLVGATQTSASTFIDTASTPITTDASTFKPMRAYLDTTNGLARIQVPLEGKSGLVRLKGKKLVPRAQQVSGLGIFEVVVKPRGRSARQLRRNGTLRVRAVISFSPDDGVAPARAVVRLTLKLKR